MTRQAQRPSLTRRAQPLLLTRRRTIDLLRVAASLCRRG
jgi:hypothetical protein